MLESRDSTKLLKQFRTGGLQFIRSLKSGKASESEILDFKLAKNGGLPLDVEDKANLARAVSGFANTRGGLLVWGVYCAKDENGEDCVQDLKPIGNVNAFRSNVQAILSQISSPAVQGVELTCISENEPKESGYLVMHVPKSDVLVESLFKKNKGFYERAGTSFVEMDDQRLVAKAKHNPLGKKLVPYLRFTAFYIGMLVALALGVFIGVAVTNEAAFQRGFAAGQKDAQAEKSKEASGEAKSTEPREENMP